MKIMTSSNFGELSKKNPKGLKPQQIQAKLKHESLSDFVIQIPFGIWTSCQKESCSFLFNLLPHTTCQLFDAATACGGHRSVGPWRRLHSTASSRHL
jgi:hypothetical protein